MVRVKNNISWVKYILFIIAIVLVIVSFTSLLFTNKVILKEVIPLKVLVNDTIGLNIVEGKLDFGTLIRGQSAAKVIEISNGYSFPLEVRISLDKGNISSFIYGERSLTLQSNESREYEVSLVLPNEVEKGIYEGNLIIEFLK